MVAILIIAGIPLYFIIGLTLAMIYDHNNPPASPDYDLEDAFRDGDREASLTLLWPIVIPFEWRIVFHSH